MAWVELSGNTAALPFADLFEPAIQHAAGGYMVSPTIARLWDKQIAELNDAGLRRSLHAQRAAPLPGETFVFPDQARTLKLIAGSKAKHSTKASLRKNRRALETTAAR